MHTAEPGWIEDKFITFLPLACAGRSLSALRRWAITQYSDILSLKPKTPLDST